MKKWIIVISISTTILFFLLLGIYELMNSRSFQLFGGLTQAAETEEKMVALTFDDGPTNNVNDILGLLDQYNAKATFFLIGNEMERYPIHGEAIVKAGHQIGNHTYSHKRMIFRTPSFIKNEINKTNELIRQAGYEGEIVFRPPNSKKLALLPYYLKKEGMKTITMDIEPDSYFMEAAEKIQHVNENIQPGSIILLHPMYDDTGNELETIEGILYSLTQEGYKFVTVNELMELEEKKS